MKLPENHLDHPCLRAVCIWIPSERCAQWEASGATNGTGCRNVVHP